ncbi:hypothetical protein PROFUN_14336 [Planoprotostelium fungivorum]|uniref:ubiquitinyl hydrolase 1 n=1 Tax=Planoprotostelium fungivorum TaxID=1890364 RepID=A0A2P6N0F1_9EUKA|nr:hypothetical protein PROFUN_14336 [Planoprotostelium fungivorum]
MGLQGSKIEKDLGEDFPPGEHYFGWENYGNTCYTNSVLQCLYYLLPFRSKIIEYYEREVKNRNREDTLLTCTSEFFNSIHTSRKRTGVIGPKRFINRLRKENEIFRGYQQQDAHEFLNYLLNHIAEILEKEEKHKRKQEGVEKEEPKKEPGGNTFIHSIFEGVLTNETKCMTCDSVTYRDEAFLDLSVDIEQNTSLSACLRNFSQMETLRGEDKFFCDTCHSKQEAEKSIKIKRLPQILVLHLKRFKYIEQAQKFKKLGYRVTFPLQLRLENTMPEAPDADRMYHLKSVVCHIGTGPNHGHYVSISKSYDRWILFDDENLRLMSENDLKICYGATNEMLTYARRSECGYLLFYEQFDESEGQGREGPMETNGGSDKTEKVTCSHGLVAGRAKLLGVTSVGHEIGGLSMVDESADDVDSSLVGSFFSSVEPTCIELDISPPSLLVISTQGDKDNISVQKSSPSCHENNFKEGKHQRQHTASLRSIAAAYHGE